MTRWEYKTVLLSGRTIWDVPHLLNDLGGAGWEAVCAIECDRQPAILLKRPLEFAAAQALTNSP